MDNPQYNEFCQEVFKLTGIDLLSYKSKQMDRRLTTLMRRSGVESYREYSGLLKSDPVRLREFVDYITINVSEFFRNREKYDVLSRYIGQTLDRRKTARVWSAGCSNGAEPYSLAILFDEMAIPCSILATDIDDTILGKAREGVYAAEALKQVREEEKRRYFMPRGDLLAVNDRVRKDVDFKHHDLLRDPYPEGFDLIVCRNVIIYFTDTAKNRVFSGFYDSLVPGGLLFIGGTESISNAREIGFWPLEPGFYLKPGIPGQLATTKEGKHES